MSQEARDSYRSQLIGAWELVEYCTFPPGDESAKAYPMGQDAKGIIMYTPDGYMSAQLQTPGQKPFGEQQGLGKESDWADLGRRYLAYTGQFYLDEKGDEHGRPILLHHMHCSSLPYLLGDTQRRIMEFVDDKDGQLLVLRPAVPVNLHSETARLGRATWRRMPLNLAESPTQHNTTSITA